MSKNYENYCHFAFICNGSDCKDKGAKEIEKAFSKEFKEKGFKGSARVFKTKCTGRCKEAPVVIVGQKWLAKVKPKDVHALVEDFFEPKQG